MSSGTRRQRQYSPILDLDSTCNAVEKGLRLGERRAPRQGTQGKTVKMHGGLAPRGSDDETCGLSALPPFHHGKDSALPLVRVVKEANKGQRALVFLIVLDRNQVFVPITFPAGTGPDTEHGLFKQFVK